jgi:phosphoribosyl 1,2-cyclic phosphodiesterase
VSLDLCILASGSSGNASVIRAPSGALLIDAGIGPRSTAKRLDGTGTLVSDIRAICLTHLDHDHFSATWVDTIIRHGIRLCCHETRVSDVLEYVVRRTQDDGKARAIGELLTPFSSRSFSPLDQVQVHPIRLVHDQDGSHGFVIHGFDCRIGYATDLGHVPRNLVAHFCEVDLLAIESNYDPMMQLTSNRPVFLKRRIMGGRGHLSNEQALSAVREILDGCQKKGRRLPSHIVLLHRSQDCNCPRLVRRLFSRDPRIAPRLVLGEPHERSGWRRVRPAASPYVGEQLTFV